MVPPNGTLALSLKYQEREEKWLHQSKLRAVRMSARSMKSFWTAGTSGTPGSSSA